MSELEFNIGLIQDYIDGRLTAEQALQVEQAISHNEQWRDTYFGLLESEKQGIDMDEEINHLSQLLNERIHHEASTPNYSLVNMRKYFVAAASFAGIVLLTFGLIKFLNNSVNQTRVVAHTRIVDQEIFPEDQIQIIAPNRKLDNQTYFDNEAVNDIANTVSSTEIIVPEGGDVIHQPVLVEMDSEAADKKTRATKNESESSYSTLLARYGYKEVRQPNLRHAPIGAAAPDLSRQSIGISRHAFKDDYAAKLINDYGQNYIARFPFTGEVNASFTISPSGKLIDYKTHNAPNKESAEVVKKFWLEKAQWQIPLDANNQPTYESIDAKIHFGNSFKIELTYKD